VPRFQVFLSFEAGAFWQTYVPISVDAGGNPDH
jgi:hypothetical protein